MPTAVRLAISDIILITPYTRADERGDFTEIYNLRALAQVGIHDHFVVDNFVRNVSANVLRGLHYQREPHAQSKLVRCARGSIYDVAVDVRPYSPTFGQHVGVILTAQSLQMLYVPEGFAHGFLVLEDGAEVHYKVNRYAQPDAAFGIRWDDDQLAIDWPLTGAPVLAQRDWNHPDFTQFRLALAR